VLASVGLLASSVWLRLRAVMAAEGYVVVRNVRTTQPRSAPLPIAVTDERRASGSTARSMSAAATNTPAGATPHTNRAMLT
jgi:hypothetical protein